eukprot:3941018-Rhodomonas_salina.9
MINLLSRQVHSSAGTAHLSFSKRACIPTSVAQCTRKEGALVPLLGVGFYHAHSFSLVVPYTRRRGLVSWTLEG